MLTRHLVAWIKTQSVLVQYVNVVENLQILMEYAWQVMSHTYLLNEIAILFKSHLKHNYVAFLCKCMI